MQIFAYTKQAYPFYYENLKKVLILFCCVSIASFLFTYLFEPFAMNPDEHKIDGLWIIILHAFIPIPITVIYLSILNKLVIDKRSWTLGKEFLHLSLILLIIGLVDFILRDAIYKNPDNWSFRYLWEEIRNTFLVGSLLLIIILPLNLERLLNKHLNFLKRLPNQQSITAAKTSIQIETPISGEQFELDIHDFLFAKVESNYIEIVCQTANGFEKLLKRLTLKELEEQLRPFPFIFKTHRSYLVNLHAISSISGNAQGYILHLKQYSESHIPVSRSTIQEFNRKYSLLDRH
ncbi:LytR/AlgR family response regulator transcription factor [Bizionia psychrotolerans]|uniref:LytR/AlgR family response regulator transcription factor n=1 Tax=Bizionia psychrotolerans TaxID=1492901 RepID=UPI0006522A96|nr:LytTR family DNA-binding domain-containing protein [Bizionia psychrotolerans]